MRGWGVMSGRGSLGENGTWQVIRPASMGVIYLYTLARAPSENAKEVAERWRQRGAYSARWNALGTKGRLNRAVENSI